MPSKDLFPPKPTQWGLRGDPYLWDELSAAMSTLGPFSNGDDFGIMLEKVFSDLIEKHGSKPGDGKVWVSKYPQSGMSGGWISLDWWREIGLPLIKAGFK